MNEKEEDIDIDHDTPLEEEQGLAETHEVQEQVHSKHAEEADEEGDEADKERFEHVEPVVPSMEDAESDRHYEEDRLNRGT